MAAERKPGSDRGRPAIDWQAAFLFYAGLRPEQRSYQAVADAYQVSVRTVERHGRSDCWKQKAREFDRDAARLAGERLREERGEALVDTEKLIDASFITYAGQLRAGSVKVTPADLARLHKLRSQLWEQKDSHSHDDQTEPPRDDPIDPLERKLEVLRALDDAGVLQRLLRTDDPDRNGGDAADGVGREAR